jgi:magnesium chelatase subunit D
VRTRKAEQPDELDARRSLVEAVSQTGQPNLRREHLYEKVREPLARTRFLFVVDSSGSHAAQDRMRLVKGAALGLMEKSVHRRDEIAVIVFRGATAEILVEPTTEVEKVRNALEYLPTGGRTPLAHALELAAELLTPDTYLVLVTDGRANVPTGSEDAWKDALDAARRIRCKALVIDTESSDTALGRAKAIAEVLGSDCVKLDEFREGRELSTLLTPHG